MPIGPKPFPISTKRKRQTPHKGSTTERGYGHAHQVARRHLLARHPVCQMCEKAFATDMHHVDGNPHNRLAENLLAVCERCHHSQIHGR